MAKQALFSGLVADEGIQWLRERRDPAKPFYLNIWTHEPHLPIESDPRFMDLYAGDDIGKRQHHGNVTQLDHAFGKVMDALQELNLVNNIINYNISNTAGGGGGKLIADTAILGFDACFPDSVVGFLADSRHCNVRFIEFFMRTAKENLEQYAPATAQKHTRTRRTGNG